MKRFLHVLTTMALAISALQAYGQERGPRDGMVATMSSGPNGQTADFKKAGDLDRFLEQLSLWTGKVFVAGSGVGCNSLALTGKIEAEFAFQQAAEKLLRTDGIVLEPINDDIVLVRWSEDPKFRALREKTVAAYGGKAEQFKARVIHAGNVSLEVKRP